MNKLSIITILLLVAAAHAAPVMVVDTEYMPEYWLPLDAEGWSVLPENTDPSAVTIYVSSSEGSDENDGLSAESPVETLAQARALCRNGTSFTQQPGYTSYPNYVNGTDTVADTITWYSDTILLKAGDTWTANLTLTMGESAENPFVVSSYGSGPRPCVQGIAKTNDNSMAWGNFAVVGIEFLDTVSISNGQYAELGWDKSSHVLFEDCLARGGIYLGETDHFSIRRCVVVDEYSTTSHSQGLYAYNCDDLFVEESLFDHNGWHDSVADAEPTIFNHNLYIKENCERTTMRGCITARASATGAQLRTGGDCINNLFLNNPLALDWGFVNGSPIKVGGVNGEITDNVVLGDANICRPRPSCTVLLRGGGIKVANVASGTCSGNIISTRNTDPIGNVSYGFDADLSDNTTYAVGVDVGINNFTLSDNIAYGWDGSMELGGGTYSNVVVSGNDIQDASATNYVATFSTSATAVLSNNRYYAGSLTNAWSAGGAATNYAGWVEATGETGSSNTQVAYTDPTRSIATYMASLGYDEIDQTVEKFLELARANSKADWDERFTADAVNDYIRAGFEE